MPRAAQNIVAAKSEAIRKKIGEQKSQMEKAREWRVHGHDGLVLVTYRGGAASWWFIYRMKRQGQRKLPLGDCNAVSLADAIQKAREARASVGRGVDPQQERRGTATFKVVAERFLEEHPSLSATTRRNYRYCLEADVFPHIGSIPVSSVTTDNVAAICQRIKARGRIVHAQRVKTTIGGVFAWAAREGIVRSNPARAVPNQQSVKSIRDRLPTDDEIRRLWLAADRSRRISLAVKFVIKLAILTGLRRKEVAGARCDEIVGDVWTIRGDVAKAGRVVEEGRMKSGRQHVVYLSRQAAVLFDEAIKTCSDGEHIFPADTDKVRSGKTRTPHVNGDSISRAIRRLCKAEGIDDLRLHDMRTAITSRLDEAEVQESVQAAILHHTPQDVTSVHYRRSRPEERLRRAWQTWADHVWAVLGLTEAERSTSHVQTSVADCA